MKLPLFAGGASLVLLAAKSFHQAALALPMNHQGSSSSRSTQSLLQRLQNGPPGIPIAMRASGGSLPGHVLWHYRMLHQEAQQWDLSPRLQFFLSQYWSVDHLQSRDIVDTILQDLVDRRDSKTLFYAGSRTFDGPTLRDFYITPIQILPSDARYHQLQARHTLDHVAHRFIGADHPAMILISAPATRLLSRSIQLGLHGSAFVGDVDVNQVRGLLERSRYTKTLTDVTSNFDYHRYLPLFPKLDPPPPV
ncbi:related to RPL40A-Ubiquitin [Sporisorium scitamineum]|uniref:Related to RPL40A-Ubiquitin n=1 Tax=Sporisorium scitamineum TaxID=49012 RepID=A0A127Z5E1_9BASI|nr:related to RPL40A-Ubiquitin [Sporisorium scitamineum]